MSDTPINLNKVRKARARADKKARAAENVVRFGQSKAMRDALDARNSRDASRLDGKALSKPRKDTGPDVE